MPRHKDAPLPDARALHEALVRVGVTDAPDHGDPDALQGLLFLAAHLHDRQKRVSFPDYAWEAPRFRAADEKTTVELAYARLQRPGDLAGVLASGGGRLVALDARPSGLKEYELTHLLYGTPTLHPRRGSAPDPRDDRVERARERGWAKTLKEHNLLAGRGLVVLDEDQGLYLSDPEMERVPGCLVLLAGGDVHLLWNPFALGGDSELQYWLAWGKGQASSEWREMVRFGAEADE